METECSFCKEKCEKNRNKNPKNSFCDRNCYYQFKSLTKLKTNCHNCSKIILKNKKHAENSKNIYCSRKCMYEKRNEDKQGNCEKCNSLIFYTGKREHDLCVKCYRIIYDKKNIHLKTSNKLRKQRLRKSKGFPDDHKFKNENGKGCIKRGYKTIRMPSHPNAFKNGEMLEHVFIMTHFLKRPLKKGEIIHHKNGIRNDNRIENLELWDKSHPSGQRVEDKIKFFIEFLEFHGYFVEKIIQTPFVPALINSHTMKP